MNIIGHLYIILKVFAIFAESLISYLVEIGMKRCLVFLFVLLHIATLEMMCNSCHQDVLGFCTNTILSLENDGDDDSTMRTYYLTVWFHDGGCVNFPFENHPRVTYEEENIIISSSVNVVSYPHAHIQKFTLTTSPTSNETGIKEDISEYVGIDMRVDAIVFNKCRPSEVVNVYNISGCLYRSYRIDANGMLCIPLLQYGSGTYIVQMRNITYKFSKK